MAHPRAQWAGESRFSERRTWFLTARLCLSAALSCAARLHTFVGAGIAVAMAVAVGIFVDTASWPPGTLVIADVTAAAEDEATLDEAGLDELAAADE